jgi:phage tail protein X
VADQQYVTQAGDRVDSIAYKAYGASAGYTEAILAANPGLADYGPLLPAGLTVTLPDLAAQAQQIQTVKLWD